MREKFCVKKTFTHRPFTSERARVSVRVCARVVVCLCVCVFVCVCLSGILAPKMRAPLKETARLSAGAAASGCTLPWPWPGHF